MALAKYELGAGPNSGSRRVPARINMEVIEVKKLVPLKQLVQEADEEGVHYLVDPEDVCAVNPDELNELDEDDEVE